MKKKDVKILIIEDEDILLDVLAKKIKDEGYIILTAKNGKDGLRKIKEYKPNLILLDIILPKIDGYQIMEEIEKENIKTNIIIISNSGQSVDIDRAIKLGASDYVIKAKIEPDEIIDKINQCLNINNKKKGQKRILLVEDDEFLRELCAKKIKEAGYIIDTASDGEIGLKKIELNTPDLILLDIIMPGIRGFEVLKRIKTNKNEKIKNIPVIMLSNLGQDSDIEKSKELGAQDFMVKANFTTDEIIATIDKYLKVKRN